MPPLLRMIALVVFIAASGSGRAADEQGATHKVAFNITAPSLVDALLQFTEQSGLQLAFPTQGATHLAAPKVVGELTPQAALEELLRGSGLKYEFTNERTVAIVAAEAVGEARPLNAAQELRLAQAEGATTEDPSTQGRADSPPAVEAPTDESLPELAEVVVTGTHIRGTAPIGSALSVISREDIERSGVATVAQFVEKLPQNFAGVDSGTFLNHGNSGFGTEATQNFSRGSTVNLRGLGAAATLVLVNGHRMAPAGSEASFTDVSLIPLSAVERIEILSDGASAVYGADAVAGVVNFILRNDFTGAETSVSYGETTEKGSEEFRASQTLGWAGERGSVLLSYEHYNATALQATERDFVLDPGGPFDLIPRTKRDSAFTTGKWHVNDATTASADAYYSRRDFSQHYFDVFATLNQDEGEARQYGGSLAVARDLASQWRGELLTAYSRTQQEDHLVAFDFRLGWDARVASVDLKADGPLFTLPAGSVKASFGAGSRREQFASQGDFDLRRDVQSAFAELSIPLLEALDLSIAGRHDHYQDVGGSTNPKIGLAWRALPGLALRGSFAKSFRAPTLTQLNPDGQVFFTDRLDNAADPDSSTAVIVTGTAQNPALGPERSRSYSLGVDLKPATLPGLALSMTYFNIRFDDRIATPPFIGSFEDIFSQLDVLAPFIDQSPDPDEVARVFAIGFPFFQNEEGLTPDDVEAIVDLRTHNIGLTRTSGVDFDLRQGIEASSGKFALSLNVSYLLESSARPLENTATVDLLNKVHNPMDLRLRGGVGWTRGILGASLNLNYSDGYQNNLINPTEQVDSWLTADLQLTAQLRSIAVALNVQNLTDEPPPFVAGAGDPFLPPLGFDDGNASPLGRMLSVSLRTNW